MDLELSISPSRVMQRVVIAPWLAQRKMISQFFRLHFKSAFWVTFEVCIFDFSSKKFKIKSIDVCQQTYANTNGASFVAYHTYYMHILISKILWTTSLQSRSNFKENLYQYKQQMTFMLFIVKISCWALLIKTFCFILLFSKYSKEFGFFDVQYKIAY